MQPVSRRAARAARLGLALGWRTRREGLRYLTAVLIPLVAILAIMGALPALTGGRGINGAHSFAVFGLRYGAHTGAVSVGLLLVATPGMAGLFSAAGVARVVRGLVGADVSRGAMEALLTAPYGTGTIAAALLGYAVVVATAFWLAMSAIGAAAIAITAALNGGTLSIGGWYFALALALPLFSSWAGAGLSMLICLLFPRLTQLGSTVAVTGGDLGTAVAVIPAFGALCALFFGLPGLGPVFLLGLIGGCTAAVTIFAVALAGLGFRPEKILDT